MVAQFRYPTTTLININPSLCLMIPTTWSPWIGACLVCVILVLLGYSQTEIEDTEVNLDEFCASIITVGPDGQYLLNWRMITKTNTNQVNHCIQSLGITNVRVARNLSELSSHHT